MEQPDKSSQEALHVTIRGRVQGVGFRAFALTAATYLSLTGWVRNRWDGAVEIHAEGDRAQLEAFLTEVRRGPRSSNVSEVDYDWKQPDGNYSGFNVRRTE